MTFKTENIRNVALLGHSGCGKTSLAETMLFEAGEIKRIGTVENKNTISDFTNIEQERATSLFTTLMHASWKDSKINILDTPGSDDFVGEIVSGLKVADTGLMVINSAHGVEVGTEIIWEHVQANQTPVIFAINQMDHEKSDYDKSLEQIKARFGRNVIPVQYPLEQGPDFNTIVDTLRMTMYEFGPDGGKPKKVPIPDSEIEKAQSMHNELVEAAAENDEALMEKFFDEGSLTEEELARGLTIALAQQEIFPVFCCSATSNMGSGRIMGFINDIAPSPADRPPANLKDGETLPADSSGPAVLFVYKTMSEPQVGRVSYFKVYSGAIKEGDELVNNANRTAERFNQLFVSNGKVRTKADELLAGDLGVTVKMKDAHTNNTMTPKGNSMEIKPIDFPPPRIRAAVEPENKNDMEKLFKALQQLSEEDPTLIIEQSASLKQTILHGQGQLHLDLAKYRVEKVHGVKYNYIKPRIPYRETITTQKDDSYRHKKQSGGAGQFAEVHMRIEPFYEGMSDPSDLTVRNKDVEELEWGGKLAFYWCIVGGSIDSKYSNAIKKGVMQKMEEGPLTGSNCQDVRVCVFDGKMHPVDSNDMAFMLAASKVFESAFTAARPQILEPIYDVEILCNDDVMGDVMGDLQTRRAIIQGMEADGHYQKIRAKVPLAEMYQYSNALRSLTQGRAKFSRTFAEYSAVTPDIQQKLINEYAAQREED
ncbi:MAG: elongation factor G [Saprospiraceae bacterium]|nr:elongation factor G [Saprospiraceae bacterium]